MSVTISCHSKQLCSWLSSTPPLPADRCVLAGEVLPQPVGHSPLLESNPQLKRRAEAWHLVGSTTHAGSHLAQLYSTFHLEQAGMGRGVEEGANTRTMCVTS